MANVFIYLSIDTLFDANGDVSPLFLPCSSYRPRIKPTSLTYCFRIVSASGSENDRTTKKGATKDERRMIREQYGFDTYPIRDRLCLMLRCSLSYTKIVQTSAMRAGSQIAEVQPILCKDSAKRSQMQIYSQPFTIRSYSIYNHKPSIPNPLVFVSISPKRRIGACPYRLYDRHQFLVYSLNAEGLLILDIIRFLIPKDAFPAPGIDFPYYIVPLTYKAMFTILCSIRSSTKRTKARHCQKGL